MWFLGKLWTMRESIEILNLSQQKEKEPIGVRTKFSYYKVFHRKPISNKNEKTQIVMKKPVYFRIFNTRMK